MVTKDNGHHESPDSYDQHTNHYYKNHYRCVHTLLLRAQPNLLYASKVRSSLRFYEAFTPTSRAFLTASCDAGKLVRMTAGDGIYGLPIPPRQQTEVSRRSRQTYRRFPSHRAAHVLRAATNVPLKSTHYHAEPTCNHQAALLAIEKALALMRSVQTLEGTDKDGVEHLLEMAAENLRAD
jgi:hypothetical protein